MTVISLEKAKKLGGLLAESPVAESLKEAIIGNVAKMSEGAIDRLILAFESEKEFLDHLESELRQFTAWQEDEWHKLVALQKRVAEDLVNDELGELDRQTRIDELKTDLASN